MEEQEQQRYFLKKDDRLKNRKATESLFAKGNNFSNFPFRIFWMLQENDSGVKAGFTASKRNFKKATDRNRIKRLIREAYRLQKNVLENNNALTQKSLHIFFVYSGTIMPDYDTVYEKTGSVIKRLVKLINENPQ